MESESATSVTARLSERTRNPARTVTIETSGATDPAKNTMNSEKKGSLEASGSFSARKNPNFLSARHPSEARSHQESVLLLQESLSNQITLKREEHMLSFKNLPSLSSHNILEPPYASHRLQKKGSFQKRNSAYDSENQKIKQLLAAEKERRKLSVQVGLGHSELAIIQALEKINYERVNSKKELLLVPVHKPNVGYGASAIQMLNSPSESKLHIQSNSMMKGDAFKFLSPTQRFKKNLTAIDLKSPATRIQSLLSPRLYNPSSSDLNGQNSDPYAREADSQAEDLLDEQKTQLFKVLRKKQQDSELQKKFNELHSQGSKNTYNFMNNFAAREHKNTSTRSKSTSPQNAGDSPSKTVRFAEKVIVREPSYQVLDVDEKHLHAQKNPSVDLDSFLGVKTSGKTLDEIRTKIKELSVFPRKKGQAPPRISVSQQERLQQAGFAFKDFENLQFAETPHEKMQAKPKDALYATKQDVFLARIDQELRNLKYRSPHYRLSEKAIKPEPSKESSYGKTMGVGSTIKGSVSKKNRTPFDDRESTVSVTDTFKDQANQSKMSHYSMTTGMRRTEFNTDAHFYKTEQGDFDFILLQNAIEHSGQSPQRDSNHKQRKSPTHRLSIKHVHADLNSVSEEATDKSGSGEEHEKSVDSEEEEKAVKLQQSIAQNQMQSEQENRIQAMREQLSFCGPRYIKKIDKMINEIKHDPSQIDVANPASNPAFYKLAIKMKNMLANVAMKTNFADDVSNDVPIDDKMIRLYTHEVKQQAAFFGLLKQIDHPRHGEMEDFDTKIKFYKECFREAVLAKPLLQKVVDHCLVLKDVKLNDGLCKALNSTFNMNSEMVENVLFSNNGLEARNMNRLLEGLTNQRQVKILALEENELNNESIDLISMLLERFLRELRILSCRITWKTSELLLQKLSGRNQLAKLALQKCSLNEGNIKLLENLIKHQRYLVDLDISWNSLVPLQVKSLMAELAANKRLQYLNLSWNNITNSETSIADQQLLLLHIGTIIKRNKNILHIDLTSCSLTELIVMGIGTALRKARSLLCIHLSGNDLGVTPKSKEYIRDRIRVRPTEDFEHFIRVQQVIQIASKSLPTNLMSGVYLKVDRETKVKQKKELALYGLSENLIFQRMMGFKAEMLGCQQWYESSQEAMPSSVHYKHNCWVCEGHIYSLLFWSRKTAFELQPVFTGVEGEQIQAVIDQVEITDPGLGFEIGNQPDLLEPSVPYICSSFTGWRYKKMTRLVDFVDSKDKNRKTAIELCRAAGTVRYKVESISNASATEKREIAKMEYHEHLRMTYEWKRVFQKTLTFENPFYINGNKFCQMPQEPLSFLDEVPALNESALDSSIATTDLSGSALEKYAGKSLPQISDIDEVFILPMFVKPGKHTYMVKYRNPLLFKKKQTKDKSTLDMQSILKTDNQEKPEIFFYKTLVPTRTEEIPPYAKKMTTKTIERVFKKETSVFKDWKEDTEDTVNNVFTEDFKHFKLYRFIKDERDKENCEALLRKYNSQLKKIWTFITANEKYPNLGLIDFSTYIQTVKIASEYVNLSTIDLTFTAATVQIVKREGNLGQNMSRFEFWEVLVRMGKERYIPREAKNYADALKKILEDHVLPFTPVEPWQEFRDEQLWVMDVNDVMEANLQNLQTVYNKYVYAPLHKQIDMNDLISMCVKDSQTGLSEQAVAFCYAMSKMTVVNEELNWRNHQQMLFVEFLEAIGRMAEQKFKNDESFSKQPLAQKIEMLMDDIFPSFGLTRNEVNIENEAFSESDNDY